MDNLDARTVEIFHALVRLTEQAEPDRFFHATRIYRTLPRAQQIGHGTPGKVHTEIRTRLDALIPQGMVQRAVLENERGRIYVGGSGIGYRANLECVKELEKQLTDLS